VKSGVISSGLLRCKAIDWLTWSLRARCVLGSALPWPGALLVVLARPRVPLRCWAARGSRDPEEAPAAGPGDEAGRVVLRLVGSFSM